MANTRYIALKPLNPGRPVEVLEKDDRGFIVGAWFGYWNFKKGIVALYPNVTNHAANWPGGVIPKGKQVISDRLVEHEVKAASKATPNSSAMPTPSPKVEGNSGVQQTIKFY